MKILSWNVNGLRAAYKKGFLDWFRRIDGDIICLQEVRAKKEELPPDLVNPKGYLSFFNPAKKPGYSGTAVFVKKEPLKIESRIGLRRFDDEGRFLRLDYSDFVLINLYLPHGGRQKENLGYKLKAYEYLLGCLSEIKQSKAIVIGDFNIAHQEIDLARPKDNKNNIMFTSEERKQIDKIIELGFIDSFRRFNKNSGHYTWWPYFANARARNLGWRIDYGFVSKSLASKLKKAFILDKVMGSDHCPIGLELAS